jgi:hypothetical protein
MAKQKKSPPLKWDKVLEDWRQRLEFFDRVKRHYPETHPLCKHALQRLRAAQASLQAVRSKHD